MEDKQKIKKRTWHPDNPRWRRILWVAESIAAAASVLLIFYAYRKNHPSDAVLPPYNQTIVSPSDLALHQRVANDDIAKLDGVKRVVSRRGVSPEIICILQEHPSGVYTVRNEMLGNTAATIEKICSQLYDMGVHSIMIEGIEEAHGKEYSSGGSVKLKPLHLGEQMAEYCMGIGNILESRPWTLYAANLS